MNQDMIYDWSKPWYENLMPIIFMHAIILSIFASVNQQQHHIYACTQILRYSIPKENIQRQVHTFHTDLSTHNLTSSL